MSSLRRGHANLLCIVPILTDDPRRESDHLTPSECRWPAPSVAFGAAIAAVSTPCATAHEDSQLPTCAPLPTQRWLRNCKAALPRRQRGDGPPPQKNGWLTMAKVAVTLCWRSCSWIAAVGHRRADGCKPTRRVHPRATTTMAGCAQPLFSRTVRLRGMGSCEQSLR